MNMVESEKEVTELVISPDTALCAGVFAAMTGWELAHTQQTPSRLSTLVLNLDPTAHGRSWIGWHDGHISGLLAGATNLKVLALKVNAHFAGNLISTVTEDWEITILEALLHNCSFPMLHALYLGNMSATAFEIGDFLRRNLKLGALIIERSSLDAGLWRDVANDLKHLPPLGLRDVHLDRLWDGFEGFHWNDIWVSQRPGHVLSVRSY